MRDRHLAAMTLACLLATAALVPAGASARPRAGAPIAVGAEPTALAVRHGVLWVLNRGTVSLSRIDVRKRRPAGPDIRIGAAGGRADPVDLAVRGTQLIVVDGGRSLLLRLDAVHPHRPLRIARGCAACSGVSATGGIIWAVSSSGRRLYRVVPRSARKGPWARLRGAAPTGPSPSDVVSRGRDAWVASPADGTVTRVRLRHRGRSVRRVRVGVAPVALARAGGALWVADNRAGVVRVLSPRTLRPLRAPIKVGGGPADLVASGRNLWVALADRGALVRIDLRTRARRGRAVSVGGRPAALAADRGGAWVAIPSRNIVRRVSP